MATMKRVSETAHLSWHDGHLERTEPTIRVCPTGGYYMLVPCEMGTIAHDHYLAPDHANAQRVVWRQEPYTWPSAGAAFDAVERLRQQR